MRKLILILSGLCMLGLSFAVVYFGAIAFDLAGGVRIRPFVFQPENLSDDRMGRPVPLESLSDKFVSERLIKKFVSEYFEISPSHSENVLKAMSSPQIFKEWQQKNKNVENNAILRRARVIDPIAESGEYYEVHYELQISRPFEFDRAPDRQTSVMYIKINFEKDIRKTQGGQAFDAGKHLRDGGDPAAIFKFQVVEIK